MTVTKEVRREMYRQMVRIRKFEETLQKVYLEGKTPVFNIAAGTIPGELHLSAGQEPVAVGICACLRKTDAVGGGHRQHHLALAHGVDMKKMAAEIFGKEAGLNHGRGGHMHLFDKETNFSSFPIIAAGMPMAVGFALARKKQGRDEIAVAVVGEGATNQGAFHESINLAALWKMGVVFVVEDNAWAVSVPKKASTPVANNSQRAAAYGIPGIQVAENDPVAVHEATAVAVARARRGDGPTLIEVRTDRLMGHFEGDPQLYRPKEDSEAARARDPIGIFGNKLLTEGVVTEAEILAMAAAAQDEVNAAVQYARDCGYPTGESALQHVFA